MKMKTIVFGVLYPKMQDFLKEYAVCINSQTDLDFELWLVNNNFSEVDTVRKLINSKIPIRILDVPNPGTRGPTLWQHIIPLLASETKKHNVDVVIFTDTDDTFEIARVQKTKVAFDSGADIVFTELVPISSNGLVKGEAWYQSNVPSIAQFTDIVSKNLLGLGHTAIRAELLSKIYPVSTDLVVTDWWIYSSLLAQGYQGHYLQNCVSFYRQHDDNIAGIRSRFDAEYIQYGVNLKIQHYTELLKYMENSDHLKLVQEEMERIKILDALLSDPRILARYMMNLNNFAKLEGRGLFWREEVDLKFVPTDLLKN